MAPPIEAIYDTSVCVLNVCMGVGERRDGQIKTKHLSRRAHNRLPIQWKEEEGIPCHLKNISVMQPHALDL